MKGHYDLGMNWGILAVLIPTIFIEVCVKILIKYISKSKNNYLITEHSIFKKKIVFKYTIFISIFFLISSIAAVFSVIFINKTVDFYHIILGPYFSSTSTNVFIFSIIGYIFITCGLLNNIYLLYFSEGLVIVKTLLISIGVNVLFGFVLSRIFTYDFAVFGFVAGSMSFYILSLFSSYKVLRSMDYYLYKSM
jgi:hypothetical protein